MSRSDDLDPSTNACKIDLKHTNCEQSYIKNYYDGSFQQCYCMNDKKDSCNYYKSYKDFCIPSKDVCKPPN